MKFDFAPMEGLTSYIYRNTHAQFFPGVEKYYAPFIAPDSAGRFKTGALRDILPENNRDIRLVPQLLCNAPYPFITVARQLQDLGYEEVNLNAGCPSATVVPKHKGAGMLSDLRSLDDFLAEVFSRCELKISVKTRLGLESPEEFPAVLEIYNKYPISELIIHARDRAGMYKSTPHLPSFAYAMEHSRSPLSYNGDILSPESYRQTLSALPGTERMMLGRGLVTNPALIRQLNGGSPLELNELREFLSALLSNLEASGLGERYTLFRLKELWHYLIYLFPGSKKGSKAINKSQHVPDYKAAVETLLNEGSFDKGAQR